MPSYDYIIAGAGAAGCVLANRLSADPAKTVLLLEAGPPDRSPLIHMPKGIGRLLDQAAYVWSFQVAGGGAAPWLRGRTLGGSTSVNGMMYVRGQPADFAALAERAGDDWGWREIGAAYAEIEQHQLGPAPTRGGAGPLKISLPEREEVLDRLLASAAAAGLPEQPDVNAPDDAEKVGYVPRNIWRGRRQSAAVAFLRPIRHRKNLQIRTGVLVDRVTFAGTRATGVVVQAGGATETITGGRIILAGGTLSSPLILQRSGIGAPELLAAQGIPLLAASPGVGANLREHSALMMQWRLNRAISKNPEYRGARLLANIARYYLRHDGPMAGGVFETGGWFKSRPDLPRPDIQFLATSISLDTSTIARNVEAQPGIQAALTPLRPRARGKIEISSADPAALPDACTDFFDNAEDREEMVAGIRGMRKIVARGPVAEVIAAETHPGPAAQSDEQILEIYRATGTCAWHAVGTCRMGQDSEAVVDPLTRVRGVSQLHVADLSIAPVMPSGNTNAPTTALAWRAAALIRGLDQ